MNLLCDRLTHTHPLAQTECSVGSHTSCMVVSPDTHLLVATGGKENDLKLWDGTKLTFQAKNVS